jgi:hypothetical protein
MLVLSLKPSKIDSRFDVFTRSILSFEGHQLNDIAKGLASP